MKKILGIILFITISATVANAEPAKSNKKLEYRFYEGCTVEQVKNAARVAFTNQPLKIKAPLVTYSQRWEEDAASLMSSEPKIMFAYNNMRWVGKFTQKDNGTEAYWLCGTIVSNLLANAFVFGTLAAGIAAANGQGRQFELHNASKINIAYGNVLEKIEIELKLRDTLPEVKQEVPQENNEEENAQ